MKTFFDDIDWAMLREQKRTLLGTIDMVSDFDNDWQSEVDNLTGILHLIDALQDHAVDTLGVPENEVFATEDEDTLEAEYGLPFPTLSVSNEQGADWGTFALLMIPTDITYVVTMHDSEIAQGEKFEGKLLEYSIDDPMPARFQLWNGEDWTGEIKTVSLTKIKSLEVM